MNSRHNKNLDLIIEYEPNKFKYIKLTTHRYRDKYKNVFRQSKSKIILNSKNDKQYRNVGEVSKNLINRGYPLSVTFHANGSNENFGIKTPSKEEIAKRPYSGNYIKDMEILYAKIQCFELNDRTSVKKRELIRKAYEYSKRNYIIYSKSFNYVHKQGVLGNVKRLKKELSVLGHVKVKRFSNNYWSNTIEFDDEEPLKRIYVSDENGNRTESLYDVFCLKMMIDSGDFINIYSNDYVGITVKRDRPKRLYIEDKVSGYGTNF
jgi:hypothetical protein